MKSLILFMSLIGAAQAGTVTLESTRCQSAYFCSNVANDANETINVITYDWARRASALLTPAETEGKQP